MIDCIEVGSRVLNSLSQVIRQRKCSHIAKVWLLHEGLVPVFGLFLHTLLHFFNPSLM